MTNNWWSYYKFREEPNLSTEPLVTSKELELFVGRDEDFRKVDARLHGRTTKSILITGPPGSGKSSFVSRLLINTHCFIRVNLSKSKSIMDADIDIAGEFIYAVESFDKETAERCRNRLTATVAETTGRLLQAGFAPGGIGVSGSSIYQKTIAPIRSIEITAVIRKCIEAIQSEGLEISLFIDETDFFDDGDVEWLAELTQRFKEVLPDGSILIAANRDLNNKMSDAFQNSRSLMRSAFHYHHELGPAFSSKNDDLDELMKKRFFLGKPGDDCVKPFTADAGKSILALSGGNFRTLIIYIEGILIQGAEEKITVSLIENFARMNLQNEYDEASIHSNHEERILRYLAEFPSHLSDKGFKKLMPRSTLHEILMNLEDRSLVRRSTKRRGIKQIYSLTPKAEYLLKYSNIRENPLH